MRQPHASQPLRPTARLGRWLFVPDQEDAEGEVRVGHLSCRGEQVLLPHSSSLLADFAHRIQQLEDDFALRTPPPAGGPSGPQVADCTGTLHA